MQARAVARYVRVAPRKVRQVAQLIRGRDLQEALEILRLVPKAAARPLEKVVRSAAANAENNHQLNRGRLYIANAYVDQGPVLRRWRPGFRGRPDPIRKKTSHITVVLAERE
ncbi:MAG TPA: 50S ribosomal protein L22 [Firmicutes bacterium]|nr:50S ribosomal protein L22 [Bacillota bacterium]